MESQSALNNLQIFLNKYRRTEPVNLNIDFLKNKDVFTAEKQLPDLYLKTRVPFDKNQCFYYPYAKKQQPNMFPRYNTIKLAFHYFSHNFQKCLTVI